MPNDHLSDKWGLCGTFDTTYGAMYVGVPQYELIYFSLLPLNITNYLHKRLNPKSMILTYKCLLSRIF